MSSWLRRIADTLTLSQTTSATGIRIPERRITRYRVAPRASEASMGAGKRVSGWPAPTAGLGSADGAVGTSTRLAEHRE